MKFLVKLLLACFIFISCNPRNNDNDIALQNVNKWLGKRILFPENIKPLYDNEFNGDIKNIKYKIFTYTDTVGCFSCRLRLPTWKYLIKDADSLNLNVDFIFYFHPSNEKELRKLMDDEKFNYSNIFIDAENKIGKLNKFSKHPLYQSMLLDNDNKVVIIGNPSYNPNIWKLYKDVIMKGADSIKKEVTTIIKTNDKEIYVSDLKKDSVSMVSFDISNIGSHPFIINHVNTSCSCIKSYWDKKPTLPNQNTKISIAVTPDTKGFFNKEIQVWCNIEAKEFSVSIKGTVK